MLGMPAGGITLSGGTMPGGMSEAGSTAGGRTDANAPLSKVLRLAVGAAPGNGAPSGALMKPKGSALARVLPAKGDARIAARP